MKKMLIPVLLSMLLYGCWESKLKTITLYPYQQEIELCLGKQVMVSVKYPRIEGWTGKTLIGTSFEDKPPTQLALVKSTSFGDTFSSVHPQQILLFLKYTIFKWTFLSKNRRVIKAEIGYREYKKGIKTLYFIKMYYCNVE